MCIADVPKNSILLFCMILAAICVLNVNYACKGVKCSHTSAEQTFSFCAMSSNSIPQCVLGTGKSYPGIYLKWRQVCCQRLILNTSLHDVRDRIWRKQETGNKGYESLKKDRQKKDVSTWKHSGGETKAGKTISPQNPIKQGVMEKRRCVLDWNKNAPFPKWVYLIWPQVHSCRRSTEARSPEARSCALLSITTLFPTLTPAQVDTLY